MNLLSAPTSRRPRFIDGEGRRGMGSPALLVDEGVRERRDRREGWRARERERETQVLSRVREREGDVSRVGF